MLGLLPPALGRQGVPRAFGLARTLTAATTTAAAGACGSSSVGGARVVEGGAEDQAWEGKVGRGQTEDRRPREKANRDENFDDFMT